MNDTPDTTKKAFFDALEGRAVTTKGMVADHSETLVHAGVQQLWDYLKLADLKISKVV